MIRILSKTGSFINYVDYKTAEKLLRTKKYTFQLCYPPTIVEVPWSTWFTCVVLHTDNTPMFYASPSKVMWMLARNLVEIISINPNIVRYKVPPNGYGFGKKYYQLTKKEELTYCAVCGISQNLTQHHVLPRCYTKGLKRHPKEYMRDCVRLCRECHDKYEVEATKLKIALGEKCGVSFIHNGRLSLSIRLAKTITSIQNLPKHHKKRLIQRLKEELKVKRISLKQIKSIATMLEKTKIGTKIVVERFGIEELTKIWREHFLQTMQPKYLPDTWGIVL